MSPPRLAAWLSVLLLSGAPATAHAYLGPGVGLGVIGVGLGFIGSIVLGFFAILWYPIKRMLRRWSRSTQSPVEVNVEDMGE